MLPTKQGLYDPRFEHDACGVSFVADLHGRRSHRMVELGLASLCNLDHRGATNAEPNVGDGAGILIQVPDRFLRAVVDFDLPPAGSYATGIAFLPRDPEPEAAAMAGIEKIAASEGLQVLGWREVPVDSSMIGQQAADAEPSFRQVFLSRGRRPRAARRHRPRPRLLRRPQAHRARARDPGRGARVLPEPLGAHPRLQGDAHLVPGGQLLHRPHRRAGRVRARPRAQPLLDQHLPVVAAGPPVPLRRPQRRDQHGDGQRELDAGPRGPARDRPHRRASSAPSRSAPPTAPTPPASTRCSSCCTSAATRSPTPC